MKLSECKIIGAITLPRGKAPFDRANVILSDESKKDEYLEATTYLDGGGVAGKRLTREDMLALLRAGQAIRFGDCAPAVTGAVLWVLRPNFEGREAALEELRKSGGMLYEYAKMIDGSFACLVREQPPALDLRDRWAERADELARLYGGGGNWERARAAAIQAMSLERSMTPERIAMLSLALLRLGDPQYADGYIAMTRNSRGDEFARQVQVRRDELAQSLEQVATAGDSQDRVTPLSEAWLTKQGRLSTTKARFAQNRKSMNGGLDRLDSKREETS